MKISVFISMKAINLKLGVTLDDWSILSHIQPFCFNLMIITGSGQNELDCGVSM